MSNPLVLSLRLPSIVQAPLQPECWLSRAATVAPNTTAFGVKIVTLRVCARRDIAMMFRAMGAKTLFRA
jgi:hypothetical protein